MGIFQASMLEAMKSREEMQSMKKASEVEVDKSSASLSKAGPSKQPDPTIRASDPTTWASEHSDAQPMDTDLCPSLPPRFTPTMAPSTRIFNPTTQILIPSTHNNLKGCVLPQLRRTRTRKKHKVRAKFYSQSSSSEEDQSSVPIKKSAKPQQTPSEQDEQQDSTDPIFYWEVDMCDLPSQYAEEVETFRHILDLPDSKESLPRSSTTVLGLDDEKCQQELRPLGHFS